jgi:hypothetical protein
MIVTTADLYQIAYVKYAIGAYNVNNLEQILGMFPGCIDSQAPFIVQLSKGARQYANKRMLEATPLVLVRSRVAFFFNELHPDSTTGEIPLRHGRVPRSQIPPASAALTTKRTRPQVLTWSAGQS